MSKWLTDQIEAGYILLLYLFQEPLEITQFNVSEYKIIKYIGEDFKEWIFETIETLSLVTVNFDVYWVECIFE